MSIRLRLTVWYSALLAFTLFLFGISIYTFVDYKIYGDIKQRISDTVNQITILPTLDFQNGLDFDVTPRDANRLVNEALFTQLTNYTNGSVKKSDEMIASRIELKPPKSPRDIRDGYRTVDIRGNEFLIYEQAITIKSQIVGAIQVLSYTGQEARFFRELRSILIISSMVTVVLAFSLGLFLAQKSLRPIENVIKATNRIQKGTDLSMRIPREGAPEDEIGQLTETINSMLGRMETFYNELDEAYRAQRRFVSDASHELRTPLTTIRGNVDLLEKMWVNQSQATALSAQEREVMSLEALSDIADESRRMTRLVNDLLSLARADAGYTMEKQYLDLKPLLDDVVRRAQFLPRKADWVIEEDASLREVAVYGNKDYLQQMLFIFIENAFKYTESGSVILSAVVLDRQVGIKIKDTGIGMNEKEVPYIFERFYRADVSRGVTSGTGLGLSIAKWIIDEHKGSVEVVTKPGEGTTFLIWLPLAVVDVDKVDPV